MVAAILDFFILAWLVGTWFYEGHHRRCTVVAVCPACGERSDAACRSHEHEDV